MVIPLDQHIRNPFRRQVQKDLAPGDSRLMLAYRQSSNRGYDLQSETHRKSLEERQVFSNADSLHTKAPEGRKV